MKFTSTLIACFLLVFTSHAQKNKQTIRQIDSLVQTLISSKKSLSVMLGIKEKNSDILLKNYGYTDASAKKTVENSNQFRIASVTKPITAVAIMTLIEKGKLNLSDSVSMFFKDFPKGNKITIYHLLSHTSGIPNWWEGEMPKDEPKDFPMCEKPHLYLQKMKTTSFFEPGTKHCYSNSGYVLLGEIIELVSGMKYEKYLQENIFAKANMKNTEVEYTPDAKQTWVKGYK